MTFLLQLTEGRVLRVLMLGVVLAGTVLRFTSLGGAPLTASELQLHHAAQALASGGERTLPSGMEQGRARTLVSLIAAIQKPLGGSEAASRVPSAVFGTLGLVAFMALMWVIGGPWAALIAGFCLAFHPESIRQSRTAGLYSLQQLYGVLALGAGWVATRWGEARDERSATDIAMRWVWGVVLLLTFFLAARTHLSAVSAAAGFGAWVVLLGGVAFWVHGRAALKTSVPLQLTAVGIVLFLAAFAVRPDLPQAVLGKMAGGTLEVGEIPQRGLQPMFYIRTLAAQYGWAFSLLPFLALLTFRSNPWLTAYLVLWFAVPLVLHSLLIVRKEERLLLMAVPAFFALVGLAASSGRTLIRGTVLTHIREWFDTYRVASYVSQGVAVLLLAFALFTMPAVPQGIAAVRGGAGGISRAEYARARGILDSHPEYRNLPLGSANALVAHSYLGRADFVVTLGRPVGVLPDELREKAMARRARNGVPDSVQFEGTTAAVVVRDFDALRALAGEGGDVILALRRAELSFGIGDPLLAELLAGAAMELCIAGCGELRLLRVAIPRAPSPELVGSTTPVR